MSVRSITVICNWCDKVSEVEFDQEDPDEFLLSNPLPDKDWVHVEQAGNEFDYCSLDCLSSHLL